jgi:hypothetical protein
MPAAVTFWRFPEEEEDFIRFLQSSGPVVGVPKGKVKDKSQLNPAPVADLLARNPPSVLLGLPNLLREWPIRVYHDERGESYAVLFTCVPVLTYRRGQLLAPNQLTASHISGDWTVPSEDKSKVVDQPEEFIKWGRKVLAWVRKETPEWHEFKTYRVTRRVSDAIKSGLQIVT